MSEFGLSIDIIGYAAALLTTSAFIPQVQRSWQTRDLSGVSLMMYSMTTLGVLLWLAFGVAMGNMPLIVANTTTLVLVLAVLYLKLAQGNSTKIRHDQVLISNLVSFAHDIEHDAACRKGMSKKNDLQAHSLNALAGRIRQTADLFKNDEYWAQQTRPTLRETTTGTCYD